MHFTPQTHPKRWKMNIFWVYFCKSEVRIPFCINFPFILCFNFEKNRNKMKWKMIEEWFKNGPKMKLRMRSKLNPTIACLKMVIFQVIFLSFFFVYKFKLHSSYSCHINPPLHSSSPCSLACSTTAATPTFLCPMNSNLQLQMWSCLISCIGNSMGQRHKSPMKLFLFSSIFLFYFILGWQSSQPPQ